MDSATSERVGPKDAAGWLWRAFLLAGVAATGAYFLLPSGGIAQAILYNVVGFSGALAIVVGTRTQRPRRPLPWYLFAAGQLAFVLADVVFNVYELVLHVESPFPSVADGVYLSGYVVLAAGLLLVMRERSPGHERAALVDAGIATVGFGVLVWTLLMAPSAHDATLSLSGKLISVAYPLMDVLLLGIAARLFLTPGARTRSYRLLVMAILSLLAADLVYSVLTMSDTYSSGSPVDGAWLLSYVLWGTAALHPSMRRVFELVPYRAPRLRRHRLAFLAVLSVMAPVAVGIQSARGEPVDTVVVVGGSSVLFLLVLVHMATLTRRIEASGRDPLTGLHNREAIVEALWAARRAAHRDQCSALLYIDLFQFDIVNNLLGRAAGDRALTTIAGVLESSVHEEDLVARMGGDEFAVVLSAPSRGQIMAAAERLGRVIEGVRFEEGDEILDIGASIGIAIVDESVAESEIISRAILARHTARARGRNQIQLYEPGRSEEQRIAAEGRWAGRLAGALRDDRFRLSFQPIVRAETGEVHAYEVLIRLAQEDGTLVTAGAFMPAAERLELTPQIDRWVIRAALDRVAREADRGMRFPVTINLSALSLRDTAIFDEIRDEIASRDIDSSLIAFEITETAAMTNLSDATAALRALKETGCRVFLDDFGSGFSSFAYLRNLPVDVLKIDAAFVRDLASDSVSRAMVRSFNELAHALGIATVAEGVEDEATLQILREIGVDLVQGYHLGRPVAEPVALAPVPALAAG